MTGVADERIGTDYADGVVSLKDAAGQLGMERPGARRLGQPLHRQLFAAAVSGGRRKPRAAGLAALRIALHRQNHVGARAPL